jgi:glycosyltransferase involved in cell wall biosynthesis
LQGLPPVEKNNSGKIVGYVGQMIPRKGLLDLISAFDSLYQENQSLKLQLLGDGSQRNSLEVQAAAQASSEAIEFLGFRSDRLELLSRFDLFVMTSSLEGIPRCIMEAMAVGVPVVAYDIPGVDQLVKHGETGLLAPLGDVNALAKCCDHGWPESTKLSLRSWLIRTTQNLLARRGWSRHVRTGRFFSHSFIARS